MKTPVNHFLPSIFTHDILGSFGVTISHPSTSMDLLPTFLAGEEWVGSECEGSPATSDDSLVEAAPKTSRLDSFFPIDRVTT
jgi:hypothetical protein